ncbi:MAG: hypothetical protein EoVTN8_513 [Fluviibacter phosphoraccumulans EoVTN8]
MISSTTRLPLFRLRSAITTLAPLTAIFSTHSRPSNQRSFSFKRHIYSFSTWG